MKKIYLIGLSLIFCSSCANLENDQKENYQADLEAIKAIDQELSLENAPTALSNESEKAAFLKSEITERQQKLGSLEADNSELSEILKAEIMILKARQYELAGKSEVEASSLNQ